MGEQLSRADVKRLLMTDMKRLLTGVSETTTIEELQASLADMAAQCEQDYAAAEQINIADKSELIARVAHAKAAYATMLHALAEREATQGFWRKWRASTRNQKSAQ